MAENKSNSFKILPDVAMFGTRHYGSTQPTLTAEPYTSGTFYIWFNALPAGIKGSILQSSAYSDFDYAAIQKVLAGCCVGVTPPGGTLNKIEYTGIGGVKWSVPGSIDYGTSISLKFIEYQGTPILDFISAWVRYIRDVRNGLSSVSQSSGTNPSPGDYHQSNYAATLFYFTTTPTGKDIEFYCAYDGVFPLKDPMDLFSSDVDTVDKQEIEIEFNVNRPIRDAWVYESCSTIMSYFTPRDTNSVLEGLRMGA